MTDQELYDRGDLGSLSSRSPAGPPIARPDIASSGGESSSPDRETPAAEQSVADHAQDKAQQAAGQAQEKAQQAAGQARARLREEIQQRSSQAAEQIGQQASDLRTVGQSLREQGKAGPASAADRLAGYAERVHGYLDGKNADQLLHDAEDLGRKRPWVAVGSGAALGLAASRLLKASSRERYATRSAPPAPASSLPGVGSTAPASPGLGGSKAGSPGPAGTPPLGAPDPGSPLGAPIAPMPRQTPGI